MSVQPHLSASVQPQSLSMSSGSSPPQESSSQPWEIPLLEMASPEASLPAVSRASTPKPQYSKDQLHRGYDTHTIIRESCCSILSLILYSCCYTTQYSLFSLIVHFSNSPVTLIVYPDLLTHFLKFACTVLKCTGVINLLQANNETT